MYRETKKPPEKLEVTKLKTNINQDFAIDLAEQ